MATGECKACGYHPVAAGARSCPRCGASNPNPTATDRFVGRGMLFGLGGGSVAGAGLGWWFGPPSMLIGGALLGAIPGLFVGLVIGLVLAAASALTGGPARPQRRPARSSDADYDLDLEPAPVRARPVRPRPVTVKIGARTATVTIPRTHADPLPWVCAACGEPATCEEPRTYSYSPAWSVPLLLVGVGVSRDVTVPLPACGCQGRREWRVKKLFAAVLVTALVVGAVGYVLYDTNAALGGQVLLGAGVFAGVGAFAALFVTGDPVRVSRADDSGVTVTGVSPAFARALVPDPTPRAGRVPAGLVLLDKSRPWEAE